jgi:hypothetical protein
MFNLFTPKARRPWRYRQSTEVMAVDHGAKTVLLDSRSEQFFALDQTAGRIWSLVAQPRTLTEIVADLGAEFDVPEAELAADVDAFLTEMSRAKLVEAV